MAPTPFYVAGRPESSGDLLPVLHPADGSPVGETSYATPAQVEESVSQAAKAMGPVPAHQRAAALDHVSRGLERNGEEIARLITGENGVRCGQNSTSAADDYTEERALVRTGIDLQKGLLLLLFLLLARGAVAVAAGGQHGQGTTAEEGGDGGTPGHIGVIHATVVTDGDHGRECRRRPGVRPH